MKEEKSALMPGERPDATRATDGAGNVSLSPPGAPSKDMETSAALLWVWVWGVTGWGHWKHGTSPQAAATTACT